MIIIMETLFVFLNVQLYTKDVTRCSDGYIYHFLDFIK